MSQPQSHVTLALAPKPPWRWRANGHWTGSIPIALKENRRVCTPSFEALFRLLRVLRTVPRTFQISRQLCTLASAQAAFLYISILIFIVSVAFVNLVSLLHVPKFTLPSF